MSMFCASCGKPMDAVHLRCPACHHTTSAFWLNLFSLLALMALVAANYVSLDYILPVAANYHAAVGRDLWPLTRAYLTLWRDAVAVAPWLLAVLIVLLIVLRVRKKALPNFARSGVPLAFLTGVLLLATLAGMAVSFAEVTGDLVWFFAIARERMRDDNEHMAVAGLRRVQADEAAYRQKNPKLGFTCKVADLRPAAAPAAPKSSGYRTPTIGDVYSIYYNYTFSFSGCSGSPNSTYRVDAKPEGYFFFGSHSFCTDQTGEIRALPQFAEGDCMKKGVPVLPEE